jgi:hypothetical protein
VEVAVGVRQAALVVLVVELQPQSQELEAQAVKPLRLMASQSLGQAETPHVFTALFLN